MAEAVVLQDSADWVHLGLGFEMAGLVITCTLLNLKLIKYNSFHLFFIPQKTKNLI